MLKKLPGKFFDNKFKVYTALLLPAFIIYFKTFWFDFTILDEQYLITENGPFLEHWSDAWRWFTTAIQKVYYRPLLMLSIVLDYHIGGSSPFIYHISNLLMHLLCVALLYRLLAFFNVQKGVAFVFSLLFSVHPVMLHAVAWVPGRNDLLLCMFSLLALIYLNKYLIEAKKKFYVLHLLFFICALLTKENAIVLPLIFAANIYVHQQRKSWSLFFSLLLCWVIISAGWYALRNAVIESPTGASANMQEVVRNFIPAFLLYTGKALLPIRQSVFPTLENASFIPGALTVMFLVILCFKPGLKNKKVAAFGLLMYFVLLLIPVWFGAARRNGEHYEHRMYTSAVGMVLFLSQVKFNTGSKIFMFVIMALLFAFVIKTSLRMTVYENKTTFTNAGLKECPQNYLFQYKKAEMFFSEGNYAAAIAHCGKALQARPDRSEIYCNRGAAYLKINKPDSAIHDFTRAIKLLPSETSYYLARCTAYITTGDTVKAMKDFMALRRLDPNSIPPGLEQVITNNWAALMDRMNRQINAAPANAQLYYRRAALYAEVRMNANANADLEKARMLEQSAKP